MYFVLTDVAAVTVTVVPVATIVMGAGVIVVVLSTVAGGDQSLVRFNRMTSSSELTERCLDDRRSCEAGRYGTPISSVGICRGYGSAIRSAFSKLDRVASLNLHNFGDIASHSGAAGRCCGRACCGDGG